jgi:hypothetical protein
MKNFFLLLCGLLIGYSATARSSDMGVIAKFVDDDTGFSIGEDLGLLDSGIRFEYSLVPALHYSFLKPSVPTTDIKSLTMERHYRAAIFTSMPLLEYKAANHKGKHLTRFLCTK